MSTVSNTATKEVIINGSNSSSDKSKGGSSSENRSAAGYNQEGTTITYKEKENWDELSDKIETKRKELAMKKEIEAKKPQKKYREQNKILIR